MYQRYHGIDEVVHTQRPPKRGRWDRDYEAEMAEKLEVPVGSYWNPRNFADFGQIRDPNNKEQNVIRTFALCWGYRTDPNTASHQRYENWTHDEDLTAFQPFTDWWCRLATQSMLFPSDMDNCISRKDTPLYVTDLKRRRLYVRKLLEFYDELKSILGTNVANINGFHQSPVFKHFYKFYNALGLVCQQVRRAGDNDTVLDNTVTGKQWKYTVDQLTYDVASLCEDENRIISIY